MRERGKLPKLFEYLVNESREEARPGDRGVRGIAVLVEHWAFNPRPFGTVGRWWSLTEATDVVLGFAIYIGIRDSRMTSTPLALFRASK